MIFNINNSEFLNMNQKNGIILGEIKKKWLIAELFLVKFVYAIFIHLQLTCIIDLRVPIGYK